MHGSAGFGRGGCEGLVQHVEYAPRIVDRRGELGDRPSQGNLIEVLEVARSGGSGWAGAADQQHGGAIEPGIGHSGERVHLCHAARDGANAGPARQAAEGIGQICTRLLVAHVDQTHAGAVRSMQKRVQTVAAQSRDPIYPVLAQAFYQQVRRRHDQSQTFTSR